MNTRSGKRHLTAVQAQQQQKKKKKETKKAQGNSLFKYRWPEGKAIQQAAADTNCRLSLLPHAILSIIERELVTVRFEVIRQVDTPHCAPPNVATVHHSRLRDALGLPSRRGVATIFEDAAGNRLQLHKTVLSQHLKTGDVIVEKSDPFPRWRSSLHGGKGLGKGDIGQFGMHEGSAGIEWLQHPQSFKSATAQQACDLVTRLGGDTHARYTSITETVLQRPEREILIRHLDERAPVGEIDFKLTITLQQLQDWIGTSALGVLLQHFGSSCTVAKLRRVEAHGQCIQFHLDNESTKTMQVVLNDEEEYVGASLLYATELGVTKPARLAGSATIHDGRIVHGVTRMMSGVRYGLFLRA